MTLLKHSVPGLWQKVAGLAPPPACLPLTSSLPGLPACRWGARPQNLGGQENNKGSDVLRLSAFTVSPQFRPPFTPWAVYVLSSTRQPGGPPGFPSSLLLRRFDTHTLFLPVKILPIHQGLHRTWHLLADFLTCQLRVTSLSSVIHSSLYLNICNFKS